MPNKRRSFFVWHCRAASYIRATNIAKGERNDKQKRSFLAYHCLAVSYIRVTNVTKKSRLLRQSRQ